MNQRKVPHIFLSTGADKWGHYQDTPWTIGWQPSYRTEAQIYMKHMLAEKPNAKIGLLYQNDDFGKDYVIGVRDVLGSASTRWCDWSTTRSPTPPWTARSSRCRTPAAT